MPFANMPGFQGGAYRPVAPEVPVADNTSAKIISAGTGDIISAISNMAHIANARQQMQQEQEQNLRSAALRARELDLKAQADQHDFVTKTAQQQLTKQAYDYRDTIHGDAMQEKADKLARGVLWKAQANAALNHYNDTVTELNSRATQAATDLKLNDANYQASNPVEWAANYQEFVNRFGHAVAGVAPDIIKRFGAERDKQTVDYLPGATLDEDMKDPKTGKTLWGQSIGYPDKDVKARKVPIWKLAQEYNAADDNGKKSIRAGLMATGNEDVIMKIPPPTEQPMGFFERGGSFWPKTKMVQGDPYPVHLLRPLLDRQLTTNPDYTRGVDEVTPMMARKLTQKEKIALDPAAMYNLGVNGVEPAASAPVVDPGATSTRSGTMTDQRQVDEAAQQLDYEHSIDGNPVDPAPLPGTSDGDTSDGDTTSAARIVSPDFAPSPSQMLLAQARAVLNQNPDAHDEIMRRLALNGVDPNLLHMA